MPRVGVVLDPDRRRAVVGALSYGMFYDPFQTAPAWRSQGPVSAIPCLFKQWQRIGPPA